VMRLAAAHPPGPRVGPGSDPNGRARADRFVRGCTRIIISGRRAPRGAPSPAERPAAALARLRGSVRRRPAGQAPSAMVWSDARPEQGASLSLRKLPGDEVLSE
jgi:hypothetical protein